MTKGLTLATVALLFFSTAEARYQPKVKIHELTKKLMNYRAPVSANKSTAVPSRLVAQSNLSYNGSTYNPNDSTVLAYSGTRGAYDAMLNEWDFDSETGYMYSGSYKLEERITKTYNGQGKLQTSLIESYDGSNWGNSYKRTYTYTGADLTGVVEEEWSGSAWVNAYKTTYGYDANHNFVTGTDESWISGAWVIIYRTTRTYNGSNELLLAIEEENAGSGLDSAYRTSYTYTGGKQATEMGESYDGSGWENDWRNTTTYDGAGDATLDLAENWDGSAWINDYQNVGTFDANHNKLINIFKSWDGAAFQNEFRNVMTYNAWNQIVTNIIEVWDGSAYKPTNGTPLNRYYYEMFNNDVKKAVLSNANMSVYPVPANDEVNIKISFNTPVAFTISITDMTGRVLNSWNESGTRQYHKNINTASLPAGSYVLHVATSNEQMKQKINVLH